MSYSTSNYLAEQQQSIQLLTSKLYGFPVTGAVTPYAPTDFVTAELFNLRNKELDGLLSYLEDTRRDETTRASLAEQALDSKYTDVAKALGGYKGIVTVFQGTTNFLDPDYQLVLATGNAFSEGNLFSLPYVNYAVTFTAGTNQKLILTNTGALLVKPEAYVLASTEQTVGVWNGSTNAYTPEPKAVSVYPGGGGASTNYEIVIEIATGLVNSTDGSNGNGTFTVSSVMLNTPAPKVYISGAFLLIEITQYTWVGNTISILTGYKPISLAAGSEYVLVEYAKGII